MNSRPEKTTSRVFKAHTGIALRLRQTGFTLVEIAVSLAIIGLALGTGITVLNARLTQAKIDTTKARVEGVRQALVAYVSQNYRLPCPAGPGLKRLDLSYNKEEGTVNGCTLTSGVVQVGAVAPAGLSRGTVPCVTLGISEEACYDAYGTRLTYFVENSAARLTKETVSGISGSITLHNVDPPAPFTLNAGNQISQGAAIVISHGVNRGGGYAPGSIAPYLPVDTGISAYEIANTDNNVQFVRNSYVEKGLNSFDDVLEIVDPKELITSLSKANLVKDPRVVVSERFEVVKQAILQNSYLFAIGSTPNKQITLTGESGTSEPYTFPATINFAGCPAQTSVQLLPLTTPPASATSVPALLGLVKDVWNNPIRYRRAVNTGFGAMESCVTPFILVSYGPDGQTGGSFAADDVVYPVTMLDINSAIPKFGAW